MKIGILEIKIIFSNLCPIVIEIKFLRFFLHHFVTSTVCVALNIALMTVSESQAR